MQGMELELNKFIIAIVTTKREKVSGGSAPTFYCDSEEERERVSSYLSRITNAMVHDLDNGCYILVKH
jgi:hypothetical protein